MNRYRGRRKVWYLDFTEGKTGEMKKMCAVKHNLLVAAEPKDESGNSKSKQRAQG